MSDNMKKNADGSSARPMTAKTIWKFPLFVREHHELELPLGAEILHVREHGIHAQSAPRPLATTTEQISMETGHERPDL